MSALTLSKGQKRRRAKRREPIRIALWLDNPSCRYCCVPLRSWKDAVLDHALPASRGGCDGRANAILSCKFCDRAKGDRTIEEWKAALRAGLFALPNPERTNDTPEHGAESTGRRRSGEPTAALRSDTGGDSAGVRADSGEMDPQRAPQATALRTREARNGDQSGPARRPL
jgi:hypothetical protein